MSFRFRRRPYEDDQQEHQFEYFQPRSQATFSASTTYMGMESSNDWSDAYDPYTLSDAITVEGYIPGRPPPPSLNLQGGSIEEEREGTDDDEDHRKGTESSDDDALLFFFDDDVHVGVRRRALREPELAPNTSASNKRHRSAPEEDDELMMNDAGDLLAPYDMEVDHYNRMATSPYFGNDCNITDGEVVSTVKERPPRKAYTYERVRNGKVMLGTLSFLALAATLLALYFSGVMGGIHEDDPVVSNVVILPGSTVLMTPSSSPSFQPSMMISRIRSAVEVQHSLTRIISSGSADVYLDADEIDAFEKSVESFTGDIVQDDSMLQRIESKCTVIDMVLVGGDGTDAYTKRYNLERRSLIENATSTANIVVAYNITWSSPYQLWGANTSDIMTQRTEDFMQNSTNIESFVEVLQREGVGIDNNGVIDVTVTSIVLPTYSYMPSYLPSAREFILY